MTPRRRLALGLVVAGVVLLAGRGAALLFSDYAWYSALGAAAVWRERVRDAAVLQLISVTLAGLFALANLAAIRRSIISLAFPRRLGNMEFGEAVPRRILDRATFLLAAGIAGAMTFMVPSWEKLALVRLGARFGETDPFYQKDLSFYMLWFPLERDAYHWCLTLLVLVSAVVISLYALTPSLRWERGSFQVSARVRRHLSVLAALFLVTMAWSYRLDGYELLIEGSGPAGMFSYVDHQWLIPAYLSLSVGTVAAAALVLLSGWLGQIRAGFFTISAVLIFAVALDLVLPSVVRRLASARAATARQLPYTSTRVAFNARAYGFSRTESDAAPSEVLRFSRFADSLQAAQILDRARDSALVYPGAVGAALVTGPSGIAAPVLGGGLRRLAHGWSEQRLDLLWSPFAPETRIVRRRDVRRRLRALMPVFTQGSRVLPAYLADSLTWVLELYTASSTYPLSRHYDLAGSERSYFRHSGTAIVNSVSGRAVVVPATMPDPIAVAWRERFPANFRFGSRDLLDELSPTPGRGTSPAPDLHPAESDSTFRSQVSRLYRRMRSALMNGDLSAFAAAYDSLGMLVER